MIKTTKTKDKLIAFCTKSEEVSRSILLILFGLFTAIFSAASLFSTAYFGPDYIERPLYKDDKPLLLIGVFIVFVLFLYLFDKKIGLDKINPRFFVFILMVYTAVVSSLWLIYSNADIDADQLIVKNIAGEFYDGEYFSFNKKHYLYSYPYQLGITAFIELGYTIFGRDSLTLLYIFNVLSICLAFFSLYRITDLTFQSKKINNLVILLLFGCFPPMMYCTFVYGNCIGLGFRLAAVWMQLKFFENGKFRYVVLSALSIAFAVIIRRNCLIVLIAMLIMYLLKFFKTRKAVHLVAPLIAVVVTFGSSSLLNVYYEARANIKISEGAPKVIWLAMGLQDSPRAPGWYNGYSYTLYIKNDCNNEVAAELAKQSVKDSMRKFKRDPRYAIEFFTAKFASQWNEPTYQGFWISRLVPKGEKRTETIASLYNGKLHTTAVDFMNIYQFIVVFGALCFVILQRKITSEQLFLGLIIFGGFLFHMFWEAKAQYTMPYFAMLVPYAAVGIYRVVDLLNKKLPKWLKKLNKNKENLPE